MSKDSYFSNVVNNIVSVISLYFFIVKDFFVNFSLSLKNMLNLGNRRSSPVLDFFNLKISLLLIFYFIWQYNIFKVILLLQNRETVLAPIFLKNVSTLGNKC